MAKDKEYELVLCDGVEGRSIYLNDVRIAGPKPWGGGKTLARWVVKESHLLNAIPNLNKGEE